MLGLLELLDLVQSVTQGCCTAVLTDVPLKSLTRIKQVSLLQPN